MTVAIWILAVTTVVLALEGGTALVQWRARLDARAGHMRADATRLESELHRKRFSEVWNWLNDAPTGSQKTMAAQWYSEFTGAARPYRGGTDDGPPAPGLDSGTADDAYQRYIEFLSAQFEPQARLGALRPRWSQR